MISALNASPQAFWQTRPARGSLYQRTEEKMETNANTGLMAKLATLDAVSAYLQGIVDGLEAAGALRKQQATAS